MPYPVAVAVVVVRKVVPAGKVRKVVAVVVAKDKVVVAEVLGAVPVVLVVVAEAAVPPTS